MIRLWKSQLATHSTKPTDARRSLITISEDIKNGRHWVNREIGKLDPNEDYATIMSMIAQYQMDEFTLNFLVTILTSYVVKPAHLRDASTKPTDARCSRFLLDLVCYWSGFFGDNRTKTKQITPRRLLADYLVILKIAMILYTYWVD